MTGDLIKIQLRDGTQYSCTGVVDFLRSVLDEYLNVYPAIRILLHGNSGFATPDLYKQCEENGTSHVIRLKENGILREKASRLNGRIQLLWSLRGVGFMSAVVLVAEMGGLICSLPQRSCMPTSA